ncbi:MAG TPA: phosphoribosylanthranilate isomerase [Solirubrobacteraceae bacterium]|nr:phosphoribosylanthranilate isomerase [Solirubrobacteraceae bacterium]
MTRAKICGITRHEDAALAAELGAWAIGLIRWPGSARACDPAVAAGIVRALRRRVACVGVFVNPTLDELGQAAEQIGFTHLQLHGDEGPAFCGEAARRTGCRIVKAVRVASGADIQAVERFHTDLHLLDSSAPGQRGGSGQAWEWSLLRARHSTVPVVLSGGLTPENVADAIAATRPWAVDSASGTESAPGIKDPERVRALLAAVTAADAQVAAA